MDANAVPVQPGDDDTWTVPPFTDSDAAPLDLSTAGHTFNPDPKTIGLILVESYWQWGSDPRRFVMVYELQSHDDE